MFKRIVSTLCFLTLASAKAFAFPPPASPWTFLGGSSATLVSGVQDIVVPGAVKAERVIFYDGTSMASAIGLVHTTSSWTAEQSFNRNLWGGGMYVLNPSSVIFNTGAGIVYWRRSANNTTRELRQFANDNGHSYIYVAAGGSTDYGIGYSMFGFSNHALRISTANTLMLNVGGAVPSDSRYKLDVYGEIRSTAAYFNGGAGDGAPVLTVSTGAAPLFQVGRTSAVFNTPVYMGTTLLGAGGGFDSGSTTTITGQLLINKGAGNNEISLWISTGATSILEVTGTSMTVNADAYFNGGISFGSSGNSTLYTTQDHLDFIANYGQPSSGTFSVWGSSVLFNNQAIGAGATLSSTNTWSASQTFTVSSSSPMVRLTTAPIGTPGAYGIIFTSRATLGIGGDPSESMGGALGSAYSIGITRYSNANMFLKGWGDANGSTTIDNFVNNVPTGRIRSTVQAFYIDTQRTQSPLSFYANGVQMVRILDDPQSVSLSPRVGISAGRPMSHFHVGSGSVTLSGGQSAIVMYRSTNTSQVATASESDRVVLLSTHTPDYGNRTRFMVVDSSGDYQFLPSTFSGSGGSGLVSTDSPTITGEWIFNGSSTFTVNNPVAINSSATVNGRVTISSSFLHSYDIDDFSLIITQNLKNGSLATSGFKSTAFGSGGNIVGYFLTIGGNYNIGNNYGAHIGRAVLTDAGSQSLGLSLIGGQNTTNGVGDIQFFAGGVSNRVMTMTRKGLGIGTTTPDRKFQVINGSASISGLAGSTREVFTVSTGTTNLFEIYGASIQAKVPVYSFDDKPITYQKIDINLPVYSAKLSSGSGSQGALIDGGTDYWRLIYSSAINNTALWQVKVPNYYSSGTLILDLDYMMTTTIAGNVKFDARFMRVSENIGNNYQHYGVANSSTVVVPDTLGYSNRVQITIADNGGLKAGDTVRVLLDRDTTVASNSESSANVLGVSLRE